MATLLGIDYGLARIGLAISFAGLAEPFKIIKNDIKNADTPIGPQAFRELKTIIEKEKVEKIIVGVSEQKMAEKTINFVKYLRSNLSVKVLTVDETLSSYEVEQKLKDLPKKFRLKPIDHYAAALILENYLDLC